MPRPRPDGALDALRDGRLLGWAWDRSNPAARVTVEVCEAGSRRLLARVRADLLRPDLRKAGIGDGRHGFALPMPGAHRLGRLLARVQGSATWLPDNRPPSELQLAEPDASLAGRFCPMPFEKLVLDYGGAAHLCCPSYLPLPVGEAGQSLDELWFSDAAASVRNSIAAGDFRFCSELCPALQQGALPPRDAAAERLIRAAEARSLRPRHLTLLHDRSCNLSCPSCRTEVSRANGSERAQLRDVLERVVRPALPGLEVLELAGGEFLASAHLLGAIDAIDPQACPELQLALFTNGTLFDEQAWQRLEHVHGRVRLVYVSLDAATPATFERLRRGARWAPITRNLEFLAGLRRSGAIAELGVMFVVQAANFEELPAFVELGRGLGADRIVFDRLLDFGTYAPAEFASHDVCDPRHPAHTRLRELLRHPALDAPGVEFGNLSALRREARAAEPAC